MKLLYIPSGHPLQEADDCLMWEHLGIEWLSTGYYSRDTQPGDLPELRSPLLSEMHYELEHQKSSTFNDDALSTFNGQKNMKWTGQVIRNQWWFDRDFIKKFDAVLISHFPENAQQNLYAFQNKPVFIKTYCRQAPHQEALIGRLRNEIGLKVIRNNPWEHRSYPNYSGHDAIIRGSVVRDENELSGWNGGRPEAVTLSSFFNGRALSQRAIDYEAVVSRLKCPANLFGMMNDEYCGKNVFLSHEEKVKALQDYRVNLVIGTPGSSNTYSFVEAWVMGQPIVAFGPKLWRCPSYELAELIENGATGFYSDQADELADFCNQLVQNESLAKQISVASREKAVGIYGRVTLGNQWRELFQAFNLLT